MDKEDSRKKQFKDALDHIEIMKNKCPIRIEDVNYLIDIGSRLLMTFEDMEKSRANWRARAEAAEAKLK
jgi:hypothetical protein